MKKGFSALLMILSLLIGFQQTIIVMHFKLNQDALEEKFCINKDQPELQCHGTCYLKRQLQKTESNESAPINIYQKVDMLPISIIKFETKSQTAEIQVKIATYKEILYKEPPLEIFVPPPNA